MADPDRALPGGGLFPVADARGDRLERGRLRGADGARPVLPRDRLSGVAGGPFGPGRGAAL